jgi:hypothetical protein
LQRVDPATGSFSAPIALGKGKQSQIRVITELSDGRFLLGTAAGGMYQYDPSTGRQRVYAVGKDGVSGSFVHAIVESSPGIVWIGTSNGLDRLDRGTDKFEHFTEADGLPGTAVNGLALDGSGQIWVSGDRGVARFNPATKKTKLYTVADGLQLHYRDYPGSAGRPPLLCLHGLTRNSRDFAELAELHSPGRRVLALDFRGRGLSDHDPLPARYLPLTYAGDVLQLLDELAIDQILKRSLAQLGDFFHQVVTGILRPEQTFPRFAHFADLGVGNHLVVDDRGNAVNRLRASTW